ncbi:MAG: TolC family protein, partial [Candidatus Zixiibacteriota bacterium]
KRSFFLTIFTIFFWADLVLAQAVPSSQKVLTIDECIEIALKNNYEVRAAEKNYDKAKYDLLGTWQYFLPRADLTPYWTRYEHAYLVYPEAGGRPYLSRSLYGLRFNVSQTIFDGGYNVANYNYYKKGKLSAEEDVRLTEQSVVLAVKNNCYALLKAQMLLEVQTEAVKRSEEQLNMAKAKYDLGAASLSDYLKAKVQLANDSLALITARNDIRLAEADLNNTLGRNIDAPVQIDAKLEYKKFDPTAYTITEETIENHPQINKTRSEVDQAYSWLTMARSENYPKIYFGVNYSWNDGRFPKSWADYRRSDDPWYVGMQVSLNIFNGLSTVSKIWSRRAEVQAAKEKLKKDRREVKLEIRKALLAVVEADQKIQVTEQALKAAEEDFNLTKEKYNLGAASMLELLDANYSYKTAKSNQVQALYDYNLAIAQFEKAIGK